MKEKELFLKFCELFPDWAGKVMSYNKIGSQALAIKFKQSGSDQKEKEVSRVFLYINDNNWQFGTKLWRRRPKSLEDKNNTIKIRIPEGTKEALNKIYGAEEEEKDEN